MMDDLLPIAGVFTPECSPLILAGPCAAETRGQTLVTARRLAAEGVRIFRAGVWKPRTKPGSFEGVGSEALEWLREVKKSTGMLTATEVANRTHVEQALKAGVDILWIGARTSTNPFAVQEIADTLGEYGADDIAVLVKNPVNPDLELWIGALQRIYDVGIRRLGAIHRGFSLYGESEYRNPPLWRIPIELQRRLPQLPILIDPSHMGGRREMIATLSQQALDMKFAGLMIESHCEPDAAWSDSRQQITPRELGEILRGLKVKEGVAEDQSLADLRLSIDRLDTELMDLFGKRMEIARRIGEYKNERGMSIVQRDRYDSLIEKRMKMAGEKGLSPVFVRHVFQNIHEESVRQQLALTTNSSNENSNPLSLTPNSFLFSARRPDQ